MAIKYIKSIKPGQAKGDVKEVYTQLKEEMGDVVEPISMHAIIPELLGAVWGILRETLVVDDIVDRTTKEAVGASVSSSNECPYCVDAHTIMIIGLQDKDVADAIVKKDLSLIKDEKVRQIVDWSFKSSEINNPPFDAKQSAEIIGTAVFFHYLNRMVTIFLGPTILPLNISFLKGTMKKMAAMMFAGVLKKEKEKGNNVGAYKDVPDLYWAKHNDRVNYVFTYMHHVLTELAKKYVPEEVQVFLKDQIVNWDGSELTNTKDLDKIVSVISKKNQILTKMLYLTAFSPHRIQDYHFEEFNLFYKGQNEAILATLSWASFMTSAKIGDRLGVKFKYAKMGNEQKVETVSH